MNQFIKKLANFIISSSLIFFIVFLFSKFSKNHKTNLYSKSFLNNVKIFEKNIENLSSINLIIGSSYIDGSIHVDSLKRNWKVFANGGQNIYESYKFLSYYSNKVRIDTLILGIAPFDFPFSYTKDRASWLPCLNGNFFYFGHDSITSINYYRKIQDIKDNVYKLKFFNTENKKKPYVNPEQYKFDFTNLDKENIDFKVGNDVVSHHIEYFHNVKNNPNMKYFDLFHSLIKKEKITLICILTPKSIFWKNGIEIVGNEQKWENIKDSLKLRKIALWDFEYVFLDNMPENTFVNEDHLTKNGAKNFTKILMSRLNLNMNEKIIIK